MVTLFGAITKKLFCKINIYPYYYNANGNPYMVNIFIRFYGDLFGVFQLKSFFSRPMPALYPQKGP